MDLERPEKKERKFSVKLVGNNNGFQEIEVSENSTDPVEKIIYDSLNNELEPIRKLRNDVSKIERKINSVRNKRARYYGWVQWRPKIDEIHARIKILSEKFGSPLEMIKDNEGNVVGVKHIEEKIISEKS